MSQSLINKWKDVIDHPDLPSIKDAHKRAVVATLLENQEVEMIKQQQILQEAPFPTNVADAGNLGTAATGGAFDPILISLVRRAMPQLMAYDICSVQPLNMPTGLIFYMKARYADAADLTSSPEALYNEADTDFSGAGIHNGTDVFEGSTGFNTGTGMATATAESLTPAEMGFTIEKIAVDVKSRALKSEYTIEMAQDLKAVHGLDAEKELANILSTEIMAEINREIIRTVYTMAKTGAQAGVTTPGTFDLDLDSDGRWSVERFKGLMYQLERDANFIARDTRRGRGNWVIVSADVASALAMAGKLDYTPALSTDLKVDEATDSYAGVLNGKYKVYVDPYYSSTLHDMLVVGYKGTNVYDAGLFYCPYVPLQKLVAVDPNTFQPKIGFKTRYGLKGNPYYNAGALTANGSGYFRKVKVKNLL